METKRRIWTEPTRRAEWANVGDTVAAGPDLMRGIVLRRIDQGTVPTLTVEWDNPTYGKTVGRHGITTLRVVDAG